MGKGGSNWIINGIRMFLVYLVGPSWASKWFSINMESTFMFLLIIISPKFGQFFQSLPKKVIACNLPDCVSAAHTRWCSPIEPSIMIFLNCLSLCFNVQHSFLSRPVVDGGRRAFFALIYRALFHLKYQWEPSFFADKTDLHVLERKLHISILVALKKWNEQMKTL